MLSTKLPNPRSAGLSPLSLCARVPSITAWPNGFGRNAIRISKRSVDALAAERGDAVFWDRDLTGFGVRVYARAIAR